METTLTRESIEDFRQWLYDEGHSEATIKGYCSDVRMFFRESDITSCRAAELPSLAARWMHQSKQTKAAKTSNRRLSSIREYGRWSELPRLLPRFNMPTPPDPEPHPLPRLAKDLEALIDNCKDDRQRCLVALCGFMGLRLHEALHVQPKHINVREMTLLVYGKRGKQRRIPVTSKAWEFIAPMLIAAMMVSMETKLIDYSNSGARCFIRELGVKACISRPIASHDLRATFATIAYIKTKDLLLVQAWLGHADVKQTQAYIQSGLAIMRELEK